MSKSNTVSLDKWKQATPTSNKLGVNGVDSQKAPRSGPKGKFVGDSSGNNKQGINGV